MKGKVLKSFYVGNVSGQTGNEIEVADQEVFEELVRNGYIEKANHMEAEVQSKSKRTKAAKQD
jgi:hypothetical protein